MMTNFLNEGLVITICFFIFVFLAFRPVKKAIILALNKKIDEIKANLLTTEKLKKDAKILLTQTKEELSRFKEREASILKNASKESELITKQRIEDFDRTLNSKKESALLEIRSKKDQASLQMRQEFTNTAITLVENYLKKTNNNSLKDVEILDKLLHGLPQD